MNAKELPSLEYLNECFELSEESPSGLVWKVRPRHHFKTWRGFCQTNARFKGKAAGYLKEKDHTIYYYVKVSGIDHPAHRVVYCLHNQTVIAPDIQIDHIDVSGLNNKPSNLRQATCSQNKQNNPGYRGSASGIKGVYWHRHSSMWHGLIRHNKILYCLGYSHSKEVIMTLVKELREKLNREFTNHGI